MIKLACRDTPHLTAVWGEIAPLPDFTLVAAPFLANQTAPKHKSPTQFEQGSWLSGCVFSPLSAIALPAMLLPSIPKTCWGIERQRMAS